MRLRYSNSAYHSQSTADLVKPPQNVNNILCNWDKEHLRELIKVVAYSLKLKY